METLGPKDTSEIGDTARHRALAAVSRVHILHLVRRNADGMTAAQVVEATGLHPSTVRAHLDQLAESGLLARHRRGDGTPGRPAWRYQAVPEPSPEESGSARVDQSYRGLAAALIGHVARDAADPYAAGVRAGRDWGRALAAPLERMAPFDGLARVLTGLGFDPHVENRPETGGAEVRLRRCPFLDLAKSSPDVVCGVHQGVIGGVLGALGAVTVDMELQPFAVPGACVVRVRTSRTASAQPSPDPSGEATGEEVQP